MDLAAGGLTNQEDPCLDAELNDRSRIMGQTLGAYTAALNLADELGQFSSCWAPTRSLHGGWVSLRGGAPGYFAN